MSSIEPRLNPSQGRNGAPGDASDGAVRPSGGANGAGNGRGNGHGAAPTVTVAAGVESALAAVQQQLARQAATITLEPPAAPPAPTAPVPQIAPRPVPAVVPAVVPAAVPAPPPPAAPPEPTIVTAPVRTRTPSESAEPTGDFVWEEARPRRARPMVDPDDLTKEERRALGKLKARKVRRIIRHVSPWSVFKVSILFYLSLWLILMVAGVILWKVGQEAGVLTNIEKFYAKASGEKVFEIDGRRVFRAASAAGAILVFAGTGFTVLLAVLFNLITDLTGGIRVSVLELENTRRVLRRGVRGERLKAKASAEANELDAGELEDGFDESDGPRVITAADDRGEPAALVEAGARRPAARPPIEFAADAIVDGRGELESSAPGLPSRGSRTDDADAAFAPGTASSD